MGFNKFTYFILFRILLLGTSATALIYLALLSEMRMQYVWTGIILVAIIIQVISLLKFITKLNEKLVRFLAAIRHNDFVLKFSIDNQLGKSFENLNGSFNEVLNAFHNERSEKEEHLQYINTIVQHVSTGLLAINESGEIELINEIAKYLIDFPEIKNIKELASIDEELYLTMINLSPGQRVLYNRNSNVQIAIRTTTIKMKAKSIKLYAVQDIQPELQVKEIESWQKLTAILRHEIMNSITPISSLSSTMLDILAEDLKEKGNEYVIDEEGVEDLKEGLFTIANRTKGLVKFIDAYRDYSNIPKPIFGTVNLQTLLVEIIQLLRIELKKNRILLKTKFPADDIRIQADPDLLKMVIINLLKNGMEACSNEEEPEMVIALYSSNDAFSTTIDITDNGAGIIPEAIDKIFIPFFTTKKTGSGIGLSLSRQIMQMHKGTLTVKSKENEYSTFTMKFSA